MDQASIGVYSPPLDAQGNSVRGIKVCRDISNEFELHAFNNRTNVQSVIRRFYRGDRVRSSRLRTAEERDLLEAQGDKIAVIETQGALLFGSTEQLLRRIAEIAASARYVVVDFKRVHLADTSARKLILRLAHAMRDGPTELLFAELANDGPLGPLSRELAERETERLLRVFCDVDAALEWCEDQLVLDTRKYPPDPKFALVELDVFEGLSTEEYRLLETIVRPLIFDKGELIIREGDQAKLFYVLARGTLSVQIRVPTQKGEKKRRVASLGGYLRRNGAVRRRRPLGRCDRRRAGDLLRLCRRAAARACRHASQHHGGHPRQSDARILGASAPRQRGNPHARVTRRVRPARAATSAAHRYWAQAAR